MTTILFNLIGTLTLSIFALKGLMSKGELTDIFHQGLTDMERYAMWFSAPRTYARELYAYEAYLASFHGIQIPHAEVYTVVFGLDDLGGHDA